MSCYYIQPAARRMGTTKVSNVDTDTQDAYVNDLRSLAQFP